MMIKIIAQIGEPHSLVFKRDMGSQKTQTSLIQPYRLKIKPAILFLELLIKNTQNCI